MLVTGATGQLGSLVMESLLKIVPADQIAVSVRNPQKAEALRARGVEVRQADFDQPETMDAAFAGIDRLLLISADGDNETRIRQHTNAVAAAARAKVGFIAYTSLTNAMQSTNFLAPVHRVTEEAIRKTGIPFSFLRNNWYLENESTSIQAVLAGAPWVTSAGAGKVGWAPRRDYAEAAAAVLTGTGHEKTVYELSGKPLSQDEFVAILSSILGREVPVVKVDDAGYADIMKQAGVPEPVVPFLIGIQVGIREGSLDVESTDLERLLGRPATPASEGLRTLVAKLKA